MDNAEFEKMLTRAMRKAVELGIFPKEADDETYLKNWTAMETILRAALNLPPERKH